MRYFTNPKSYYENLFLPSHIKAAGEETWRFLTNRRNWNEGDLSNWFLNQVMAVHPLSRFLMSMIYLSHVNGLTKL
jgi:hypothetical protein